MKVISLKNISPAVEVGLFNKSSQLWEKELVFEKGKKYLLVSQSGRGKTSTIAFMYGLRFDFTGEILLDKKNTRNITQKQWSKIRSSEISVLFQDLRLFNQLSATDNILLKSEISAFGDVSVESMATALGVAPLMDKYCDKLSFGEQQRIAIIRSLIQPFDFLMMDEPFSHLDKENIDKALILINEACRQRNASLIITSLGSDYGMKFDKIIEV